MKKPISNSDLITIAKKHFGDNGLAGVEFLRAAASWLDSRIEMNNERKTPTQLLKEFARQLEQE